MYITKNNNEVNEVCVEIFFDDLNLVAQEKLLQELGDDAFEERNWDVFPVTAVLINK